MNHRIMKDYREDFERWARDCVRITDKLTERPVPFRLNAPQRRVLGVLEEMRRGGEPIRLIMLKARQWGGSALFYLLIYLKFLINFVLWKRKL